MGGNAPKRGLDVGLNAPSFGLQVGPQYRGPTSREDSSLDIDLSTPITYVIPTSSAQFTARGLPAPTHCWKFDILSGAVIPDLIGGTLPLNTYMGADSIMFEQTASGIWDGSSMVATKCIESGLLWTLATHASASAFLNPALTGSAVAVGLLYRWFNGYTLTTRAICGNAMTDTGGGVGGWGLRVNNVNQFIVRVTSSDGFVQRATSAASKHGDGAWHVLIAVVDRINNVIRIVSDVEAAAEVSIAAATTIESTSSFTLGRTVLGSNPVDPPFHLAAMWAWTGSAVPTLSALGLDGPRAMLDVGKDPTGRIGNTCFTGTFAVPVASSSTNGLYYATYHGNAYSQLPFAYDKKLSNARKLGLYSARSAINYITSSMEMHVWQASDGATLGARTTAPDGMSTAELLGGTGTKTFYFTVGATPGTRVSGYSLIKAQTGTVPGRIIIYDSTTTLTASVIAATSFTSSVAWDRWDVSAVLGGGVTRVSYAIEYTNPVYTWGNTFVSGFPTVVIHTTASLGAMHRTQYVITGSAGSLLKANRGKLRATVVGENDTGQLAHTIAAVEYGGGNANRVLLQLTGSSVDQFRGEVRDSNGTLAAAVQTTSVTASGEHDVELEWDNTGTPFRDEPTPSSSRLRYNGIQVLGPQGAWTATETLNSLWIGCDVSGSNNLQGVIAKVSASYRSEMV